MIIYSNNTILEKVKQISKNDNFEKDFFYHYLYILSHIRTYPFYDKRFEAEDFIPVHMKVLKKMISYNYAHKFIYNLLEAGVIKSDNFYIAGLKAKGYKLTAEYKTEKFFVVECKDLLLKNKIEKVKKLQKNMVFEESFGYGYVTNCMEDLVIEYDSAVKFIKKYIKEDEKEESYQMMTALFRDKFATVDDKGKRLHNNLTNIAATLRQFITYKKQPLVQVDIKNSQPLFLYLLMKKYYIDEKEMEKYKNVVINLGFYEFFAEKLNYKLTKENRKEFKQKIFSGVLFDRNRKKYSRYEVVFKEEFPAIFHLIREMKTVEYEQVAINLQKTESKFVFYCVEKIAKEKKIPMLTIHDSICTTEGNEESVKKEMAKQFNILYNTFPKLNVEKFV